MACLARREVVVRESVCSFLFCNWYVLYKPTHFNISTPIQMAVAFLGEICDDAPRWKHKPCLSANHASMAGVDQAMPLKPWQDGTAKR